MAAAAPRLTFFVKLSRGRGRSPMFWPLTTVTDPPQLVSALCKRTKTIVTYDRWGEVNPLSKFQLPSSHSLGLKVL